MMSAVKYSEMAAAATIAMAIDSSIVIRFAAVLPAASLKIGHPPIRTPNAPTKLTLADGSHKWNQTAAALSATSPIRTASIHCDAWPLSPSLAREVAERAWGGSSEAA